MIYAGELGIVYPIFDLYDKQLMQMSIAAAKDMYEKGLKLIEDFNNKYGDFMSPIQKDMDWYNQNVTGKVRDTINNLYANGIDPLRSAEGRAAVAQLIYSMPTGDIAKLRLSAETAKEYLKSFGDDTNPELEKFLGRDLSNWSTLDNGVWGYNKASKYQTIDDLIEPIVKNVDYTYDEAMTKAHNDGHDYYSITKDRLAQAVNDSMADILATPSGAFHWELAKREAAAQGGGEELAKSIFNNMINNRLSDHERTKKEVNQFALDNHRTANDIKVAGAKAAIDFAYDKKRLTDPVFAAAAAGSGKGGKKDQFKPNIFREAEANADNVKAGVGGKFGYGVYSGDHVGYVPSGQYAELIDPITPGSYVLAKDKNSGQQVEMWKFNNTRVLNNIYTIDQYGKVQKAPISNNFGSTSYTFIPDGLIKAAKAGNSYRYYVSGTLKGNKNTSPIYNPRDNNSTQLWIEVKERGYSYDGK